MIRLPVCIALNNFVSLKCFEAVDVVTVSLKKGLLQQYPLCVLHITTDRFCQQSFAVAVPRIWNHLPITAWAISGNCCSTDHRCSLKSAHHRHWVTHYIGCRCPSAFGLKSRYWHLTVFMVKHQDTLMYQSTPLELVLDYDLQIMVTWSSHICVLRVSFSTAYTHLHHLCGTTFRLNWRTATLVDRVSNLALSHGFLSVPIRNRHLCELLFKGCYYVNLRIDWLIDWLTEWTDRPTDRLTHWTHQTVFNEHWRRSWVGVLLQMTAPLKSWKDYNINISINICLLLENSTFRKNCLI